MNQPEKTIKSRIISYMLTPFAWCYGAVTFVRNLLYDKGVLRSASFTVPVVSVGNISVGGTGKTPHVEYILDRLSGSYRIAVLSRGYKRKTRGFVMAGPNSTPETIGDEPFQIYKKFGRRVRVAVCENRAKGIEKLCEMYQDINLVVLDDAFQHRGVAPKVNVLLVDYSRPVYHDYLLPLGRLREGRSSINRADIVIMTKSPASLKPVDMRNISNNLALFEYQELFFSWVHYGDLRPVFEKENNFEFSLQDLTSKDKVLLLTGIANPRPFIRFFKRFPSGAKVAHFPDHHDFSHADIQAIEQAYDSIKGARRVIITTEKDAVRLAYNPYFPERLKPYIFYLPISVEVRDDLEHKDFVEKLRYMIDRPEEIKTV